MPTDTKIYDGFRVSSIATPREQFVTCVLEENLTDIAARNTQRFDFMPVLDHKESLVGVVELSHYFDKPAPAESVSNHFVRLAENHLIGANAGILDYILEADRRRFCFVVSQTSVIGLVCLSDLQELSVRATLFSVVTNLELSMQNTIRRAFAEPDKWQALLHPNRRANIEKHLEEARKGDGAVDPLLYTQFCDKRDILLESILKHHSERDRASVILRTVEKLRNALAHANEYAETSAKAAAVCQTVRDLLSMKELIDSFGKEEA
ncbi:hypothetical protein E0H65_35680 [Rhizobium leguminosarum bv. viciae]|nr:hypothetical protein E0H65_35680 [Rhizobium leguminosarum bv. viciae]